MKWYKSLSVEQRYFLRTSCHLITGVTWEMLGKLFTYKERIELIHQKLKLEGFDI